MNKSKKKSLGIILCVAAIIFFIITVITYVVINDYEGDSDFRLDLYDTTIDLQSDGSAWITETHDLKFDDRDKPWWNYYKVIDFSANTMAEIDLDSIKVKVDGVELPYPVENRDIDLDNQRFYNPNDYRNEAYTNTTGNQVELGVVLDEFDSGKKKVVFIYRIDNILLQHPDVNAFYYQLVPSNNTVPIKYMTASLKFPVNSEETLRSWLHIDSGNGSSKIANNSLITFEANEIFAKKTVECRVTLDKANYDFEGKTSTKTFAEIKAEEEAWANAYFTKVQKLRTLNTISIVLAVIVVLISITVVVVRYIKRKPPIIDNAPEYIREPSETWTIEEAMPLFHYYAKTDKWWNDTISATIMNLIRRGFVHIEMGEKKKSAKLSFAKDNDDGLSPFEKIIFNLMHKVNAGEPFTMKEFERWTKNNSHYVAKVLDGYKQQASVKAKRYYPKDHLGGNMVGCILFMVLGFILTLFISSVFMYTSIALVVCSLFVFFASDIRKKPLPREGQRLHLEFKAFANYMTDFGSFEDNEIPEMVLWEEYMVWATGMGIADKVSEQLALRYPEFKEMYYYNGDNLDTFVFLYLFSPSIRNMIDISVIDSVTSIATGVYNARMVANVAAKGKDIATIAGGFGGGGFSGGGGGFGGGGGMGAR